MRQAGCTKAPTKEPNMPGWSLHETGTCRMGNDPKHFVTNRFGQTHDVKNLYVCDASVFPSSDRQVDDDQHHGVHAAHLRSHAR